jgi:hypothetical protein
MGGLGKVKGFGVDAFVGEADSSLRFGMTIYKSRIKGGGLVWIGVSVCGMVIWLGGLVCRAI